MNLPEEKTNTFKTSRRCKNNNNENEYIIFGDFYVKKIQIYALYRVKSHRVIMCSCDTLCTSLNILAHRSYYELLDIYYRMFSLYRLYVCRPITYIRSWHALGVYNIIITALGRWLQYSADAVI